MKSLSCIFFTVFFLTLGYCAENEKLQSKTVKLPPITDTGAIQQLFDPPSFGGLDFSFYNVFASFVNQTRMTIPDIAYHGNFTLIQLALLGAVGAMAAGVATIVAEGKYFREQEEEADALAHSSSQYGPPGYQRLDSMGQTNPYANEPQNSYADTNTNFIKAPLAYYDSKLQSPSNPYVYHNGNQDLAKRRKKRDASSQSENESTTESHKPVRKRVKKKRIVQPQQSFDIQESQNYEIPSELLNGDAGATSNQIPRYYSEENVISANDTKSKSNKSPKILSSGEYPRESTSTEKKGYYINLEQQFQNNYPINSNGDYQTNYYEKVAPQQNNVVKDSQQSSKIQQNDPQSSYNQNFQDPQSAYVSLGSQVDYNPSDAQIPSNYPQKNTQQIQPNPNNNYYQSSDGSTGNINAGQGEVNVKYLYYRNQSQNSANSNDPDNNYYYQTQTSDFQSQRPNSNINPVNAPPIAPTTSNQRLSQEQIDYYRKQYLASYDPQNSKPQQPENQYSTQVQLQQQYPAQQPQQQYPAQQPQQQYPAQQPQQQYPAQQPQQQYPAQPPQYPAQQPQQQYPAQQPQQQYPAQQPQQQYPAQQPQQQYPAQQPQQQYPAPKPGKKYSSAQQPQQQYPAQQPQQQYPPQQEYPAEQLSPSQQEELYLQEMQPPLSQNFQNLPQFPIKTNSYAPPKRFFQEENIPPARIPNKKPTQSNRNTNINRNSQVAGQTPYYMNPPYTSVNSNKKTVYRNYVLPNGFETTTSASFISRILKPFGLLLPPRNKNSNVITRSFQKQNNRAKRVQ